jgi:HAD superfamily hydrolase (TIGR01459 family)
MMQHKTHLGLDGLPVDANGLPHLEVPRLLPGVRSLVSQYEAFILDLWGVIHDGATAFPNSAETLRRIRDAGCKTMLLSNAPRRSHVLISQMENFGIPRELYGEVMSSGEAVRQELLTRKDPAFAALGNVCYHLGPERDQSVFEDVPLRLCETIDEAEFIVNTGPRDLDDDISVYESLLEAGAARKLPMVCANPDKVVIRQGKRIMCAGAMADRYIELGGTVLWRGKPDAAIYALCLEVLGTNRYRTAVVGDALETDIRGAANAGISSVWVTGGIHARELDGGYGKPADPNLIAPLCRRHGLTPTAILPGFIW